MWDRVRWSRVATLVVFGLLVGYLAGGSSRMLPTAIGFLIGGIVFELWFNPWLQSRLDRRFDEGEQRRR